ncbi:acetyl-CoA carboxylase, carboxyltransferase subunit beta [Amycolatopsis lurida]|uniref:acetyl-CoA carboxylase, carboxyltransferase subunit beta n=1 Tax=Amycolatopsis lurida TaxID=31959 RepID=UPI00364CC23D
MKVTAPDGVAGESSWSLCSGCRRVVYRKRLERESLVCPECGFHQRLTALERIGQLFDEGSVRILEQPVPSADVLGFTDTIPYPERLAAAKARTGLDEAVVVAEAAVNGRPLVAAVMDFRFLGGSLGAGVGTLIVAAAETALRRRIPLLLVCASGGARMQEGALALMQMARTSQALAELDEAGILTLSVITDPTYGGVAASFALLADVVLAEPGARLGFAGRRVIEQTIRQRLPDGFQTAEFLAERGLIDGVRSRNALRDSLTRLLAAAGPAAEPGPGTDGAVVIRDHTELAAGDPWAAVRSARDLGRPTTLDLISRVFTDFEELRGDRLGGDCAAVVGGPARLDGTPVMVVGQQKGHTAAELAARNYGMPSPQGYRKAARLMRLAAKLGLPVITLVDTPGAYPGLTAEEDGQAFAIADNLRLLSGLAVPVITVITGEGGSGGALALAVADEVLMFSGAVYSVITPEGCAAILWNDPSMASAAARALRVDARELLRLGVVDGVILEPEGGNQADPAMAAERLRGALVPAIRRLAGHGPDELVRGRRARFRAFDGAVGTAVTEEWSAER